MRDPATDPYVQLAKGRIAGTTVMPIVGPPTTINRQWPVQTPTQGVIFKGETLWPPKCDPKSTRGQKIKALIEKLLRQGMPSTGALVKSNVLEEGVLNEWCHAYLK